MVHITSMKVIGLTVSNFRNHTETTTFDFGDLNYITGHNGTGKTSIAHAICFALYGVNFYGEQKIDRLMNEASDNVQVQLRFLDQNGIEHTLVRTRKNEKYSLLYDGYSTTQSIIEQIFGDKNTFLSMFNPTYLVETMGSEGRELLLHNLKPISKNTVLSQLPEHCSILEELNLDDISPEQLLKETRSAIRKIEQQLDILQGHVESFEQSHKSSCATLDKLLSEKNSTVEQLELLKKKQFEGININDFSIQRVVLTKKLNCHMNEDPEITSLKEKLSSAKARTYTSKYTQAITEVKVECKSLNDQYNKIYERINTIKVGDTCPTCMMTVNENNIEDIKAHLSNECNRIVELGHNVITRGQEISTLERQAKDTFEQYKSEDIAKLTAELEKLTSHTEKSDISKIHSQLEELSKLEQYGNLSELEYVQLQDLGKKLISINAQIETIKSSNIEEKLKTAITEKEIFTQQKNKYINMVSALTEYIFKSAELATSNLSMPNVTIRLFDVIRSTGEIKSTFKFDYKGREYSSLSLSEKILAGIEISALMRKITEKDYPICIDNTESIASFNNIDMPSQIILIRVVKDQPLAIRYHNSKMTASNNPELRKAA